MNESLDFTNIQLALDHQRAAQHGNCDITEVAQQAHAGHYPRGQELGAPGAFMKRIIQLFKAGDAGLFTVESFQDDMPAIHFFHVTIDMPQVFLLTAIIAL